MCWTASWNRAPRNPRRTLRQGVEALQTAKSEGTVDGPSKEASALRTAQLMGADYPGVRVAGFARGEQNERDRPTAPSRMCPRPRCAWPCACWKATWGRRSTATRSRWTRKCGRTPICRWRWATWSTRCWTAGRPNWPAQVRDSADRIEAAKPAEPVLATVTMTTPAERRGGGARWRGDRKRSGHVPAPAGRA